MSATPEPAREQAHAFGGFVGPRTLLGFVHVAVPWLAERPVPAPPPDDDGARLLPLAFDRLGWWHVLARAERLAAQERPTPAAITDYFALCLAAHWATAASYVPTDVDAKIRDALWLDQGDEAELAAMVALARQLRDWDVHELSARWVDSSGCGGPGIVGAPAC